MQSILRKEFFVFFFLCLPRIRTGRPDGKSAACVLFCFVLRVAGPSIVKKKTKKKEAARNGGPIPPSVQFHSAGQSTMDRELLTTCKPIRSADRRPFPLPPPVRRATLLRVLETRWRPIFSITDAVHDRFIDSIDCRPDSVPFGRHRIRLRREAFALGRSLDWKALPFTHHSERFICRWNSS